MDKKNQQRVKMLRDQQDIFLKYLKAKFPIFHNSNFFFRDFHYGIKYFLDEKLIPTNYHDAEECAIDFSKTLEKQGIFVKVNDLGWRVNYKDFATAFPGDPF